MIVSAHPDDEAIGCSAKLIRAKAEKNKITILYVTDGEFYENSPMRREEARKAMGIVGIKDLVFMKYKGFDLTKKELVDKITKEVGKLMRDRKPKEVYTPVFEGGNYEHDVINYVTNKAAESLEEKPAIYEFPMYNNRPKQFMRRCMRRARRLLGFGFYRFPPRFPNEKSMTITVEMSAREMEIKKQMLETYESQNGNNILTKCYMYPDVYRLCPKYNYHKRPHGIIPMIYETNTKIRFKDFKRVTR